MAKWAYLRWWCTCILYSKPGGGEELGKSQKQFVSSCGPGWRAAQLSREGAESPQTLNLTGHPAQLWCTGGSVGFGPLHPSLSKDPSITGVFIGICPLHNVGSSRTQNTGNTVQIEALDLFTFLIQYFLALFRLCVSKANCLGQTLWI